MPAYYNEFKPEAAHMLRQLIKDGLIAPGDVDERSIVDVASADLIGYEQCHFFAGIGGWSVALRLAGWEDSRPVWTGSCPCQPFSSAGQGKGQADERHLWPDWYRLIRECHPPAVFGEQVSKAIAHGWLDEVKHDLESNNYAFAAALLPACAVKAPHERERIWFVSYSQDTDDRRDARELPAENGRSVWDSLSNEIHDSFDIRCEGSFCETVSRKSRESWKSEREFADFNGGWPIHSAKLRSVDDGLLGAASCIHALGNAIVPQVAAEFIKATM